MDVHDDQVLLKFVGTLHFDHGMSEAVSCSPLKTEAKFDSRLVYVVFVLVKFTLGQVSFGMLKFSCHCFLLFCILICSSIDNGV